MGDVVEVVGISRVQAALHPDAYARGLRIGMTRAGEEIRTEQQRIARPHHYRGRLEQGIRVQTVGAGLNIETHIGISTAQVPEGRPLNYGWRSEGGKRPPSSALVPWVLEKFGAGLTGKTGRPLRSTTTNAAGRWRTRNAAGAAGDAQVRSIAFLIARKIGQRGYSFGKLDWLHGGFRQARPRLHGILAAAMREGHRR